jgi:myo-inositol 2-dehydrogenase/D-chiro-inositol 1-dehydrogenase
MAATDTIGVAFLGVGRMGETHLRNIAGLHGVRVIAVADPRIEAGDLGRLETFRALSRDTYPPSLEFLRGSGGLFLAYDHFENFPDRFEQAYRSQLQSFFEDLKAGRKPSPGPEDALETLRLAVAVTKSWKEQRPVKVVEIQG